MDVLIVGAGPVGLMLAGQLQRRGVSYRLVEARAGREYWCKALGVSHRTLEIFDQLGIVDEAVNRGLFFTAVNTMVNGETYARVEVDPLAWPYGALGLGQYDTEEILEADLRRHGGRIEWGSKVKEVVPGPDSVTALLESGERIESRFLVGCDGAHSLVRKTLGLEFEGAKYPLTFLLGDVEMDWPHPHSEVYKLVMMEDNEMRGVVAVVPIPGNPRRYRLSMNLAPDSEIDTSGQPPLELIREIALPALPPGTRIENLRWSSFYNISHRLVSRYRVGRLFLAGDAAHIHPPIGGLGMNTGLQDAYNLGWKLALGGDALLETYHEERRKIGEEVVGLTAGRMNDQVQGKGRDENAEERANTQFFVSYAGLSLAFGAVPEGDRGAAPGERVDFIDGLRRSHLTRRARLIDLMRDGRFHLFGYGGAWDDYRELARLLRARLDVTCWALGEGDLREEVPVIEDPEGNVRAAWGDGPGAVLVRPDGYVLWRGRPSERDLGFLDVLATSRQ